MFEVTLKPSTVTGAECNKEAFGENRFPIYLFVYNENSRWLPDGHILVFFITTNFI